MLPTAIECLHNARLLPSPLCALRNREFQFAQSNWRGCCTSHSWNLPSSLLMRQPSGDSGERSGASLPFCLLLAVLSRGPYRGLSGLRPLLSFASSPLLPLFLSLSRVSSARPLHLSSTSGWGSPCCPRTLFGDQRLALSDVSGRSRQDRKDCVWNPLAQ